MSCLRFRTDKEYKKVLAVLFDKNGEIIEHITLDKHDCDKEYVFGLDLERVDHVLFDCDGERTGKIYLGNYPIGIEYKHNKNLNKNLTYLYSGNDMNSGIVENYILEDSENLAYRSDKSKRISVFLPRTYDGVTPHDIFYFFDAQNLFGSAGHYTDNGDPYGSWQLDTALSFTNKNVIVVGIDNSDEYRDRELFMRPEIFGKLSALATALPDENYSEGYLDSLSDFMIKTLHPFIKQKYCVNDSNIGIGGASMGGIASFYCGLRETGFYKYVLSYSPAFALYELDAYENWFEKSELNMNKDILPKIHIYCGEGDPLERLLVGASKTMKLLMSAHGYAEDKIFETFDTEKPHNEESWRLVLPQSLKYLL